MSETDQNTIEIGADEPTIQVPTLQAADPRPADGALHDLVAFGTAAVDAETGAHVPLAEVSAADVSALDANLETPLTDADIEALRAGGIEVHQPQPDPPPVTPDQQADPIAWVEANYTLRRCDAIELSKIPGIELETAMVVLAKVSPYEKLRPYADFFTVSIQLAGMDQPYTVNGIRQGKPGQVGRWFEVQ